MRHLASKLAASARPRGGGARYDLAPRLRGPAFAFLVALPILITVLFRLSGVHMGAGLYGQLWLLPVMIVALQWSVRSAVAVTLIALVSLDPPIAHVLVGAGENGSLGQWLAQAAMYSGFLLALSQVGWKTAGLAVRPSAVENAPGTQRLAELADSDRVLASLANTVEIRDHHTQGHCRRVARNALVMARALELRDEEVQTLYWAGTLHDLGKIAVPEYILLKAGRLSEEEFSEIRRHPMYGADLLASVSQSYRPIADVVRAHHERWDGLGYPLGLKGHDIPELARVIAIVDVFEALTSERPYRTPMPESQALQYVRNGSGTQFDPRLVEVFSELHARGEIECATDVPTLSDAHMRSRQSAMIQNA